MSLLFRIHTCLGATSLQRQTDAFCFGLVRILIHERGASDFVSYTLQLLGLLRYWQDLFDCERLSRRSTTKNSHQEMHRHAWGIEKYLELKPQWPLFGPLLSLDIRPIPLEFVFRCLQGIQRSPSSTT